MPTRRPVDGQQLATSREVNPPHIVLPVSPFANADAAYYSDDSSDSQPSTPVRPSPSYGRRRPQGLLSPLDRATPSRRPTQHSKERHKHCPAVILMLIIPIFLMLAFLGVFPTQGNRHHKMRSNAAAHSHGFGWGSLTPDEQAVADFREVYQNRNKAGAKARARALYGSADPTLLWNASFATGPSNWPLGSQSGICNAIASAGVRKIAIVGNGPLTDADRALVQSFDRVLRFNAVNNMLSDEPVDVWIVRYNQVAPLWYWGFIQLPEAQIMRIVNRTRRVLFIDGPEFQPPSAIQDLLYWFPLDSQKLMQLNITEYWRLYSAVLDKMRGARSYRESEAMPSSGLLGLLAALPCFDARKHELHLFGFNWSPKSYYMHKMTSEEIITRELITQYNIMVHAPACEALYSCDPRCDSSSYRASVDGTGDDCTIKREARKARREAVFQQKKEAADRKAEELLSHQASSGIHPVWQAQRQAQVTRHTPGLNPKPIPTPVVEKAATKGIAPAELNNAIDPSQHPGSPVEAKMAEGALAKGSDPVVLHSQQTQWYMPAQGSHNDDLKSARSQQEAAATRVAEQIRASRINPNRPGVSNPRGHVGQVIERSTMYPELGGGSTVDLGLEPRLANLRRDVLALLTDGHRIEQAQARSLTDMLRANLHANGRLQELSRTGRV